MQYWYKIKIYSYLFKYIIFKKIKNKINYVRSNNQI